MQFKRSLNTFNNLNEYKFRAISYDNINLNYIINILHVTYLHKQTS